MKFATKHIRHYRLTLGMLLHYLGKLKENANKLHFKCSNFNSSTRVPVYFECVCVFIKILFLSLNTMLTVDKHCCDEFPVPQIDRQSKQVKEQ